MFYSFDNMANDLTDDLQTATQGFFEKNQLLKGARGEHWQDQMTTPLSDVARELLMFGANEWPLGGHENVVRILPVSGPSQIASLAKKAIAAIAAAPPAPLVASHNHYALKAALLFIGLGIGALAYSPIAYAMRAMPFISGTPVVETSQVHIGESFVFRKIVRLVRPCQVTIDRNWLDASENTVVRERVFGFSQLVTEKSMEHRVKVKVPDVLKPGHYTYTALYYFNCGVGDTYLFAEKAMSFDLLAPA